MTAVAAGGTNAGAIVGGILAALALLALWWLPVIVARHRRLRGIGAVVIVTALLGWTVIGWVVALAMAFGSNVKPPADHPAPGAHR